MSVRITWLLAIVSAAMCAGCSSSGAGHGGQAGLCAFTAHFHGKKYLGEGVQVAPRAGRVVGMALLPGCDDHEGTSPTASQRITVAQLPGAPVSDALVWVGHPNMVIVRDGASLPPAVRKLMRAPACRAVDAPIRMSGPWGGIIDANGHTEVDLVPPYNLELLVRKSSAARYERAFLTVGVPLTMGHPLTKEDIRTSLWKGGSIALTVTCNRGRYVATAVNASPPL
jgi:hypothetical protein